MKSPEEYEKKASVDLFKPYRIGRLELQNRFVRSATHDHAADNSGAVTDNSVAIYRELGKGGIGLIVTGFAFVSPLGQAMEKQYGVHTDDMLPGLRRLVKAAHQGDAKIALQIVHAGINSLYLSQAGIIAQAVSKKPELSTRHREMSDEEIEGVISDFASAAVRAREAGFDAVQLHGAHGYLISQFLSPLYNLRNDQWGGSAGKRRRFHLELVRRVRQAVGDDFPLLIKFGVHNNAEGGLALSEALETAQQMVAKGVDAIEVSTSEGIPKVVPVLKKGEPEHAPFRESAAAVKRVVTVPVMLVGGIRSLEMATNIVNGGDADLISMCRPFIREPDLIARWQRGEKWPSQCLSCQGCRPSKDGPVHCHADATDSL